MNRLSTPAERYQLRSTGTAKVEYSERTITAADFKGVDMEKVRKRRAVEETIEARRMLNEMGILL